MDLLIKITMVCIALFIGFLLSIFFNPPLWMFGFLVISTILYLVHHWFLGAQASQEKPQFTHVNKKK